MCGLGSDGIAALFFKMTDSLIYQYHSNIVLKTYIHVDIWHFSEKFGVKYILPVFEMKHKTICNMTA